MAVVTMKQLLEAGVHFGHQTRRWNPKMRRFIFGERNGIYIIDLQQTLERIDAAYRFIRGVVEDGGSVLFVGTKKQAQEPVQDQAQRSGMPYVNYRWLGGSLTNFQTVHSRVSQLRELERLVQSGETAQMPKKEALKITRDLTKLQRNLGGIRNLEKLPNAIFVIDTKKEHIAVTEANRLGIAVVAVVDTNCDPDVIDYVIPGNDDAIRSAALMSRVVADAVEEGRQLAQRKGVRPPKSEEAEKPPPDPEAERRKADEQRLARTEAAKAQEQREARLRDAKKKQPPPPPDTPGDGDVEGAKDWLRTKGLAGAAKRAGREAQDGAVDVVVEDGVGAIVELNCETDFVAKGADFRGVVASLAKLVAEQGDTDLDSQPFEGGTVGDAVKQLGAKLGENVSIGRVARIESADGIVDGYKHIQNERGTIGVLVEVGGVDAADARAREIAHDVALHVASAAPQYVTRDDVPADVVEKERAVLEELTRNEGKPEQAVPKIVEGRLNGFYKNTVLVEQPFIREPKTTVGKLLGELGKEATVRRFVRIQVGAE